MAQGEHESLTDQDPHALLFGHDDDLDHEPLAPQISRRADRAQRAQGHRIRRHRRAFGVMAIVVVVFLAFVGYFVYTKYENRYHPKDFANQPGAVVVIKVADGDGADAIGKTLFDAKVVGSVRAFANAAAANPAAANIAPGSYRIHQHLSARSAVTALLDPSARIANDVVVFDGATVFDVIGQLAKALHVSSAAASAAIDDVAALPLPAGYSNGSTAPTSVEGFLYPATYTFDDGTSPVDALSRIIANFIANDRSSHFAADAKTLKITPYQALIIASIAEKEAKMPADFAKVARVILNRIAAGMPLQIDATSAYAAKLQNLDPTKVIYATIVSPYNTYTHNGLPPTPISNPGPQAMNAAVHPASGDWLYYVNGDKAGDLYFTDNENDFEAAVARCRQNNWGCG